VALMAHRSVIQCAGLATDPSPLLPADGGGLRLADNVIIDRPGSARQRPCFAGGTYVSTTARPRSMHCFRGLENAIIVSECNPDRTSGWALRRGTTGVAITTPTDGAEPLSFNSRVQFAEARDNAYSTSLAGLIKLTDSVGPATLAGMHEAPSGQLELFASGADVALPTASAVAYRWCFRKIDANGVVTRSAPSPWQSISNTTGSTRNVRLFIPLVKNVADGDQIEVYRTYSLSPATSVPSDMLYLARTQTVNTADVVLGRMTVIDWTADDDLGVELYTNPTREGLLKANGRPPASYTLAQWASCMWFGRTQGPGTCILRIAEVVGLYASGAVTGLLYSVRAGISTTNGSAILTGFANTDEIAVGMLVQGVGIPFVTPTKVLSKTATTVTLTANATVTGTDSYSFYDGLTIDGTNFWATSGTGAGSELSFEAVVGDNAATARNLAYALSIANLSLFAYAIEDPFGDGAVGTVVIRESNLNGGTFAVTSTRTSALQYGLNTSGGILVEQDARANGLAYSKLDEPEHVPELNYLTVGSESHPIVALTPLRTALLVWKADGLYRVTGSGPDNWRVDLLDSSCRVLNDQCVDVIDDMAIAWTTSGVVMADESGAQSISEGLIDFQLRPSAQRVLDGDLCDAWVKACQAEGFVLVAAPQEDDAPRAPSILYCYVPLTRAWSRWDLPAFCAVESSRNGGFFLADDRNDRWNLRQMAEPTATFQGHEGSFLISSVTVADTTVEFAIADAGNWTPQVGDWLNTSTEFRSITDVTDDGTTYTVTIDEAFTASTALGLTAYEAIISRVQWQAQTAGSPAVDAFWREIHIALDWSEFVPVENDPADATMLVGASSNVALEVQTETWTMARAAYPSTDARVMAPRATARASHVYPYIETRDFKLPWRVIGMSLVYETTSERTRR
jgi:hypothetical protein